MSEKRMMTGDLYGLSGRWAGGEVVDHLVRGTRVELGRTADGEPCLFANGREYPLDAALLYDVRKRSKPAPDA